MANDPLSPLASPPASLEGSSSAFLLEPGLLLAEKYRLVRTAGFGGMGAVWVAMNEATGAEVAVKILVTAHQGVDREAILRFRREAHAAAQLYHRGIVRIFDLVELSLPRDDADSTIRRASAPGEGVVPDALVLVMELLRGETLASLMDKKQRFSLAETVAMVVPLLSALAHAHAQGIVHRDVKPENVFLATDPDGHVIPKILDFGISKLLQPAAPRITTDGAMMGTPNYMSPEQARGLPDVDARADVFAAGILVYECLSGENPFSSGSYHSVVAAILERDPKPLTGASPEVWRVIKRALEKVPALRYADAGELGSALVAAAQTAGVQTPESSGAYPARGSLGDRSVPPPFREQELTIPSFYVEDKRRTRLRKAVAGGVVAAVVLLAVAGMYARGARAPLFGEPSSASASPVSRATAPSTALPVLAPAPVAPALPEPTEPAGATTITVTRSGPDPALTASAHARPPARSPPARAKPAPSAAPSGPAAKSSVVRDPGF